MKEVQSEEFTLSVSGREVNYEYRLMDIYDIRFYRKNPRIASILSTHDSEITDEFIDGILWERNETHKLYRRIEGDGGLIHPIIVYKGEVLEGNTRLCCYRHLFKTKEDEKWKYIRCHEIIDELDQEDIYRLLCTEHIEGKIDWDAYEKANLYYKMKNEDGMSYGKISDLVGEAGGTVRVRIKAYNLMLQSGVVDKNKYSHFDQLVRSQDVKKIRKRDPEIVKQVVELIKDEKIPKATDIRKIGDVYKHKKARDRLFKKKQNIEQVYHDLKAKAPMTDSSFMRNVEELITKVKKLKREEREGLGKNKRDCYKVEQLVKELISLCREMNIKIHVPKKMKKG